MLQNRTQPKRPATAKPKRASSRLSDAAPVAMEPVATEPTGSAGGTGPDPSAATAGGLDLRGLLGLVGSVIAPTTLITALLFYFGYVMSRAEYGYFGLDIDTIGWSTRDVLLRSVSPLFVPTVVALFVGLLALWVHAWLRRLAVAAADRPRIRLVALLIAALSLLLLARGAYGVLRPQSVVGEFIAATPTCLGFGFSGLAYARLLDRRVRGARPADAVERRIERVGLVLVVALIVLSAFWVANRFAIAYGRGNAVTLLQNLDAQPAVVLDTKERLYLGGAIAETRLPAAEGQTFTYRYRGLRLLLQSGSRLFLLPDGWSPDGPIRTLVVTDTGAVRIQLSP